MTRKMGFYDWKSGNTVVKEIPSPTMDKPSMEELEEWVFDGICEATDGCQVEPDGRCQHGHVSWLMWYGLI